MIERVYKVKLITPLIMAGSNPREPEIRTQSIKGIIRWWYRFIKASECESPSELRKRENEIWGSTERASRVLISLSDNSSGPWKAVIKLGNTGNSYLCMNDQRVEGEKGARKPYNRIRRSSFLSGEFFLRLRAKEESFLEQAEEVLKFLFSFGGLGARWRRGFGSVEIYKNGVPLNFDLDNIKAKGIPHKDLKSFPNLASVDFWEIWPSQGNWRNWQDAMNSIRDKFYRPLKKLLDLRGIGSANPRCASPLIISIKEKENRFYGVVLVHRYAKAWEKSSRYQNKNFRKFIRNFDLSLFTFQDVTLKKLR